MLLEYLYQPRQQVPVLAPELEKVSWQRRTKQLAPGRATQRQFFFCLTKVLDEARRLRFPAAGSHQPVFLLWFFAAVERIAPRR